MGFGVSGLGFWVRIQEYDWLEGLLSAGRLERGRGCTTGFKFFILPGGSGWGISRNPKL